MLVCEIALALIGYHVEEPFLFGSHRFRLFEMVAFQCLHVLDPLGDVRQLQKPIHAVWTRGVEYIAHPSIMPKRSRRGVRFFENLLLDVIQPIQKDDVSSCANYNLHV